MVHFDPPNKETNKMAEFINFPAEDDVMKEAVNDFPSIVDFTKQQQQQQQQQQRNTVIPWRDVECNTPLKVLEMNEIMTVNGKTWVITLQKPDNTIFKTWPTNLIEEDVLKKQSYKGMENVYILSLGLKKAQKSKQSYYDFKTIIYK